MSATDRLMSRIANRLRFAAMGVWFYRSFLALGIALGVGLLSSRLLGFMPPQWFQFPLLGGLAGAALLLALILGRKPSAEVVARKIDARSATKDLFLTAAMLRESPAEYAPIVAMQADEFAPKVTPAQVVPFQFLRGVRDIALVVALLAAGIFWLPQLDPFRMEQARKADAAIEKKLAETKKLTELRKEELKEKSGVMKEQVEQALTKLDKTLKDMKPVAKTENDRKLNEEAMAISELWKKSAADLPKMADNMERAAQQFGDKDKAAEMKKMLDDLKKGDATALKQALENARKKMEEIAKMPEGEDRKKQMEQLAKELAKMGNQMREQVGAKNANEAIQRALEQMGMAKDKNAPKDAMQAAADSLNLSKDELQKLAEQFQDAGNLEDALKAISQAKQLNKDGKLDGGDAGDAKSMADYEKLYKELLAKNGDGGDGDGEGEGDGKGNGRGKAGKNPGIGKGGTVGENPDARTAMKEEKAKTKTGAGKLLMQWKEEGHGETGVKAEDYQEAVRAVREGVAESIRNERIPSAYHESIQKYFDRIPDKSK